MNFPPFSFMINWETQVNGRLLLDVALVEIKILMLAQVRLVLLVRDGKKPAPESENYACQLIRSMPLRGIQMS